MAGQHKQVGLGTSVIRGPHVKEGNPSQGLAKQDPSRSPQREEGNEEDEDMSNASEV